MIYRLDKKDIFDSDIRRFDRVIEEIRNSKIVIINKKDSRDGFLDEILTLKYKRLFSYIDNNRNYRYSFQYYYYLFYKAIRDDIRHEASHSLLGLNNYESIKYSINIEDLYELYNKFYGSGEIINNIPYSIKISLL